MFETSCVAQIMRPFLEQNSLLEGGKSMAMVMSLFLIKHPALNIYEAVVVQLLILLNCQHQMGDVSGQLHVLAILPAEKFPLVPVQ